MLEFEWHKIEQLFSRSFGSVLLNCDGYEIAFSVVVIKRRLTVMTYVNGQFKGKWLMEDCPERSKFMRKRSVPIYNSKQKKEFKKILGKFYREELYEKKIETYSPFWPTYRILKKHLIENNKEITLIDYSSV